MAAGHISFSPQVILPQPQQHPGSLPLHSPPDHDSQITADSMGGASILAFTSALKHVLKGTSV